MLFSSPLFLIIQVILKVIVAEEIEKLRENLDILIINRHAFVIIEVDLEEKKEKRDRETDKLKNDYKFIWYDIDN